MWIADHWKEFAVIDCGGGEKIERWGNQILQRPDPQAIWETPHANRGWKNAQGRYHRSSTGGGHWDKEKLPEQWQMRYRDLTFQCKPMNFKHTGLFPEQAVNWDFAREKVRNAGRPVNVLNLFAYTGGATLAAANAGPIRWIVDDCKKFVQREIRRGRKYDAIIMDPPSYGRGPSGETWKIEEDVADFVELTMGVLSDKPLFVLISSYSTGLAPSVMSYLLGITAAKRAAGKIEAQELGLPVEATGLVLPCGSSARFIAEA